MNEHEFGARIKARREDIGLSQKDLAFALNLDQGKVSLIEKGLRRVDVVKELPVLARFLKVSIGWFYDQPEILKNQIPIEALVHQYFPDVKFSQMEMKRIGKFIEPIVQSYVENDPEFKKRVDNKIS